MCLALGLLPFAWAVPSFHELATLIDHHAPELGVYAGYILLHTVYLNHEAIRLNYLYFAVTHNNRVQAWLRRLGDWAMTDPSLASVALTGRLYQPLQVLLHRVLVSPQSIELRMCLDQIKHYLFPYTENVNYVVILSNKTGRFKRCGLSLMVVLSMVEWQLVDVENAEPHTSQIGTPPNFHSTMRQQHSVLFTMPMQPIYALDGTYGQTVQLQLP